MAAQLQTLLTLTGDAEFTAPLSEATSLQTGETWDDWFFVRVGELVKAGDRVYKVIGFTIADTIVCVQHGLDYDPAVRFVELVAGKGLEVFTPYVEAEVLSHSTGLVEMAQ